MKDKMKTKHIIFGLAFNLSWMAGLTSCDVLDIEPRDSITDESFWNTVTDLQSYAEGFYQNLSSPSNEYDGTSDDRLTDTPDSWLFDEYTIPSSSSSSYWNWENIRDLNYFMARYDQVDASESEVNPWVAVIRFFRSLDYFDKIKTYGDVPWYEKDLTTADTEELYKARDDRFYVLSKIIEDLEYAIEWLPDKSSAETGALHKDCARTQLARVCLHYGTYMKYHNISSSYYTSTELLQMAVNMAKEVMDSGSYSIDMDASDSGSNQASFDGFSLPYSNLFTMEDLTSSSECILPRIYEADVLTHNLARTGGYTFSKDFAECFLCTDGLPISNSPLYQGDETIDDEFTNRDPRIYQILDSKFRPYTVRSDGSRIINAAYGQTNTYDANTSPSDAIHSAPGLTSGSGYTQIKLVSASQSQQTTVSTSTYDWFVYRYAEILLIRAEAECELGTITQTILDETINQLRDRVGMPHLTMNPVTDQSKARTTYYPSGVSDLLYEIRRERRIELAAEGFRYDDVMRWNAMVVYQNPKTFVGMRITDEMKSYYQSTIFEGSSARSTVTLSDGNDYIQMYSAKSEGDAGRIWSENDKRLLYPIPTTEITIYQSAGYTLEQNPGW